MTPRPAETTLTAVSVSQPTAQLRFALTFAGTVGLGVLMPLFLLSEVPDVGRSQGWWLTLAVMVWSGYRLAGLCVKGAPRLFDFFFWLFAYIFMGMAPTIQIRADEPAVTTPGVDPFLDVATAALVAIGVLAYEIGHALARFRGWNRQPRAPRSPQAQRRAQTVTRVDRPLPVDAVRAGVLLAVSLLLTLYFVSAVGAGGLVGTRAAAFAARSAAWPDPAVRSIVYGVAIYPLLISAGALSMVRRAGVAAPWRVATLAGLGTAVGLVAVVANPISSARYTFGTVAFALAVFLGATRTTTRVRVTMTATIVGFLFAFPLADRFRSDTSGLQTRSSFFGEYLANPDYDGFWQVANAWMYWQDDQATPLRQFLGSVLFWVPRAIWSDKPTDTGILLAEYRGYFFTNLSAPMWAELLVNGGVVALVAGFLGLGYALRRIDDRLQPAFVLGGVWGVAGAVFPVYMVILLRGSWLQATGALFIAVACVWFVRARRPPATPASPPPTGTYPAQQLP